MRALLPAILLCLLCLPLSGRAENGSGVTLGQLQMPSLPQASRLPALEAMAAEVTQRTSIPAQARAEAVPLLSDKRLSYPLLVLPCATPLPELTLEEGSALSTWLRTGGTLLVDWQGGAARLEAFRSGLEGWVQALIPGANLERISRSHVLFRSFYRLKYASGRVRLVDDIYGVLINGRYAVVVTYNDMLSAAERTADGAFRYNVVPGGANQREDAIRFLVNFVSYALCLDYKDDKVHLDYLKSKRNWQLPGDE